MRSSEHFLLSYLLNSVWQLPLLFSVAWLAARALRPAGVAAEHRVWVSAGLLESLLPACCLLPWEQLRLPAGWLHGAGGQAQVTVMVGPGIVLHSLRLPAQLSPVIALGYSTVCVYFAARFLWRGCSLIRMRHEAKVLRLTGESARAWARCSRYFDIRDAAAGRSSRVFGPVTVGIRHKMVLLPEGFDADSPDLPAVLAHEFAHMRRNDFAKNLFYELLLLPVSYHPLCWLTRRQMNESREMVCDQMAAELSGRRPYARSLLRLASLLVEQTPITAPHAIGLLDANTLERRLMKLSEKAGKMRGVRLIVVAGACAFSGVATCASAVALRMHPNGSAGLVEAGSPETAAPRKIAVSNTVMAGNILSKVAPKYPEAAKKAGIQGTVVLAAVISKEGTVDDLQAVSGPADLRQSALDAVRQWTYKPYLLNGEPVEVQTTVNVTYSLAK